MTTMMRVSEATRERVMKVAVEDLGGATADEAVVRLLDIYWQAKCIAAVDAYIAHDPDGWGDYVREAQEWDAIAAPITEPWDDVEKR